MKLLMVFASGRCPPLGPFLLLLVALADTVWAQDPARSHVERFSSRQAQDQRTEADYTARLQANPQDGQALLERGLARLRLGRQEEALTDLSQAAGQQPPSADARAALAYAYLSAGRLPQAMEAARAALQLDPRHAGAHFYAGRVLLQTGGDLREAIEHLEKSAERNPEDLDVQFELFAAYRRADDIGRAARQLGLMRMLLPPQHPGILYSEGLLQADLGNLGVAIERFQRALKANPRLDSVRQDLGIALVQTNRWREGVEVLEPLVQARPESFVAAYFHALA
ncbi:MAG: tetratricopeptide repeat protein, partial [Terriglobales bacterium]